MRFIALLGISALILALRGAHASPCPDLHAPAPIEASTLLQAGMPAYLLGDGRARSPDPVPAHIQELKAKLALLSPDAREYVYFKSMGAGRIPYQRRSAAVEMLELLLREREARPWESDQEFLMRPKPKTPRDPTESERGAIYSYVTASYGMMNRRLRAEQPEPIEDLDIMIEAATDGLGKMPSFEGPVYRTSGSLPPDFMAKHVEGGEVVYDGFTSTSKSESYAAGTISYVIWSKTGRPVDHEARHDEAEVLFPPYTRFRVLKKVETAPGATGFVLVEIGADEPARDAYCPRNSNPICRALEN